MRILLIVYDNGSHVHFFPMGIAALAAVLEKNNSVEIFHQDVHHYPDEYITEYLNNHDFDLVGLSFIGGYYQYRKASGISQAVNRARKRPFYVLGGHGPSPDPEFFIRKMEADAVCIGEGEETILELVDALKNHRSLQNVAGLAYRSGSAVVNNPERPSIRDLEGLPFPAYNLLPVEYYRLYKMPNSTQSDFVLPMLSGRGCPYRCNFCYRMDEGFRPRSNESIAEEMILLKKNYGITYVVFSDDLLMSSVSRTESFCKYLLRRKVNMKWYANGRLNIATPALLRLMQQAGCVFLNYGIESFDNRSLELMNKNLTEEQIVRGVEATLDTDIMPGLNMIFGNHGDTMETLRKSVDFLLKYDDGQQKRTIRPVTPYPGSPLYYDAIASGLLKDCEDFYENKHLNSDLLSVNFTELTDAEYYKALHWANSRLLNHHYNYVARNSREELDALYSGKKQGFRGFRTV